MNYRVCTIEELATHLVQSTCQAVTQQLKYHRSKGNSEIVLKIQKARILAKQMKLLAKMESLDAS